MEKKNTHTNDGIQYLLGSAGSLILACPKCGDEIFSRPEQYFIGDDVTAKMKCFSCRLALLEPINMTELETRWKPFWQSLGHEVRGIDYHDSEVDTKGV